MESQWAPLDPLGIHWLSGFALIYKSQIVGAVDCFLMKLRGSSLWWLGHVCSWWRASTFMVLVNLGYLQVLAHHQWHIKRNAHLHGLLFKNGLPLHISAYSISKQDPDRVCDFFEQFNRDFEHLFYLLNCSKWLETFWRSLQPEIGAEEAWYKQKWKIKIH